MPADGLVVYFGNRIRPLSDWVPLLSYTRAVENSSDRKVGTKSEACARRFAAKFSEKSSRSPRDTLLVSPYFPSYYQTCSIKSIMLIWKLYFLTTRRDTLNIFIYLYHNFILILYFILYYIFCAKTKQILSIYFCVRESRMCLFAYFIFFYNTLHQVNNNLWIVFPTI